MPKETKEVEWIFHTNLHQIPAPAALHLGKQSLQLSLHLTVQFRRSEGKTASWLSRRDSTGEMCLRNIHLQVQSEGAGVGGDEEREDFL